MAACVSKSAAAGGLSVFLKSANHSVKGKHTPNQAEAMEHYLMAIKAYLKGHGSTISKEKDDPEEFNEVTE